MYLYSSFIIPVEARPLLGIGLGGGLSLAVDHWGSVASSHRLVLCVSHLADSDDFTRYSVFLVAFQHCVTSSGKLSPLKNLSTSSTVCFASNVLCPLRFKCGDSSSCVFEPNTITVTYSQFWYQTVTNRAVES